MSTPTQHRDLTPTQLQLLWATLVSFVLLCHWDWLVLGLPIHGADISTYYTPFYEEYRRQFAAGRFPLWTDTVFSGHPIVAEGQVSLLHPLMNGLLHVAGHRAGAIWLFVHALIGAAGMWTYCRTLGTSRFAAVLSALAMGTSGFFAVRVIQPNYFATLAYLPWQLVAVERLCLRGAAVAWIAPLAVVSALQWLCGHPQIPILSSYLLGLYALLRLFAPTGADERSERNWAALPKVAAGLVAGLLLASIQTVPLILDVVRAQSERSGGVSPSFASFGSLPPQALLLPLFPALYGTSDLNSDVPYWPALTGGKVASWETHIYMGAALLLLAVFSLRRRRENAHVRVLAILALTCALYALGKFSPVFWAMHYLPGLNLLRVPSRAIAPVLVFALPLAALALDSLARSGAEGRRAWQRTLRTGLLLGVGFWLVLGVGVRTLGPAFLEKGIAKSVATEQAKLTQRENVHPATRERRLEYARSRPARAVEQIEQATSLNAPALSNFGFLALIGLMIAYWARTAGSERFFHASLALFLLCGAELVWFNREFGARGARTEAPYAPPVYRAQMPPGKFFSAVSSRETLGENWQTLRRRAPALASLIWEMPTPDGRTSMQPAEYVAMLEPLRDYGRSGAERLELIRLGGLSKLRLMGVSSFLTLSKWGRLNLPALYEDSDVILWRVPAQAPSAFLVDEPDIDDAESWRTWLSQERPAAQSREKIDAVLGGRIGETEIASRENPDFEVLDVRSPREAWLVRMSRNMSGWRASVDGVDVPIVTALGHFQGVRVPAGGSRVVFRYEPRSFGIGAWLSGLSALALVGLLAFCWQRERCESAQA